MFKEKFDTMIECSSEAIMDFLWLIGDRKIEIVGFTRLSDRFIIVHCKATRKERLSFVGQHQLYSLANIIDKEKEEQE